MVNVQVNVSGLSFTTMAESEYDRSLFMDEHLNLQLILLHIQTMFILQVDKGHRSVCTSVLNSWFG